jgi:hypothetical protein
LLNDLQVFFVYCICLRDHLFVPAAISSLVSAEQQQCRTGGIEGVKDAIGPPLMLNSQLPHVAEFRPLDSAAVGEAESWPSFHQHQHHTLNAVLFGL